MGDEQPGVAVHERLLGCRPVRVEPAGLQFRHPRPEFALDTGLFAVGRAGELRRVALVEAAQRLGAGLARAPRRQYSAFGNSPGESVQHRFLLGLPPHARLHAPQLDGDLYQLPMHGLASPQLGADSSGTANQRRPAGLDRQHRVPILL